jgi:hypothetical protein
MRRFQYAFGLTNPGEQYFQPWIGLLKLKKAKHVAVVRTSTLLYSTVKDGVASALSDNNMILQFDGNLTGTAPSAAVIATTLGQLQALDPVPDGVLLAAADCVPWIEAFAAADFAPKSVAGILCSDGATTVARLGDKLRYVVGSSQWATEMGGSDYNENLDTQPWALFPHVKNGKLFGESSPLQFQDLMRNLTGNPKFVPGYSEGAVLTSFSMLEGALYLANSTTHAAVMEQLRTYYQPSWYGLQTTDRYGQNKQKQLVINQRDENNELRILSPASVATNDFVYPMPLFRERVYTQEILAKTVEKAIIALVVVCCTFTLALMAYLFANRKAQVFQAAGLPFYLGMVRGRDR